MLLSGLAFVAVAVIVGSGFAVWNFESGDDASKGIYNIGLYVTPKVDTVGTISTNNDYALILDQGALPQLTKEETLAQNKDYYKRGIYVGQLKKKAEGDGFETLPTGSYDYTQIPTLTGYWIQEAEDAQNIVGENVNDMSFQTTIKLRKKAIARYVQVNTEDGLYEIDEAASAKDEYINYVYNWGNLGDVLKNVDGQYRITKTKKEFYDYVNENFNKSSENNEWLEAARAAGWDSNENEAITFATDFNSSDTLHTLLQD